MKLVRKREGDIDLFERTGDILRKTMNIKIKKNT